MSGGNKESLGFSPRSLAAGKSLAGGLLWPPERSETWCQKVNAPERGPGVTVMKTAQGPTRGKDVIREKLARRRGTGA